LPVTRHRLGNIDDVQDFGAAETGAQYGSHDQQRIRVRAAAFDREDGVVARP
jgi:hypothetical protein